MGAALAVTFRLGLEWRASMALLEWEDRSSAQLEATAARLTAGLIFSF
jgi:hypothetical protein